MVWAGRAASAVKTMVMEGTGGGYWNIWSFHGRIYRVLVRLQGALEISTAEFRIAGREKKEREEPFLQKEERGGAQVSHFWGSACRQSSGTTRSI